MMPRVLHGRPKQRMNRSGTMKYIGALDCETVPWRDDDPPERSLHGRVVCVTAAHEKLGGDVALVYASFADFLCDIFTNFDPDILSHTTWFSHNGEYDWRYMVECFEAYPQWRVKLCERAEGKIYEIEVLEDVPGVERPCRITTFRDSMAIYTRSLREFAQAFAPNCPKGSFDFTRERFDPSNETHLQYAKQDVLSLMEAVINYDAFIYEHFGVHLKGTAPSTSYQAWLRTICQKTAHYRQGAAAEKLFRKAYFGGLVQCNALVSRSYPLVFCYDINSSYPASMRLGVPIGRSRTAMRYKPGKPGFYEVEFHIGKYFQLPIIGHRNEKGELSWPTNQGSRWIKTFCSSVEIEYAKRLGYRFSIRSGFYWDDIGDIFKVFVDKCEALRKKFKGEPTEYVIKLMQNSLYGRFGMRGEGKSIVVSYKGLPSTEPHERGGDWAQYEWTDDDGGRHVLENVYWRPVEREAEYMLPHWAAWITAQSRLRLDAGCRAVGVANCLYRDTDSIFVVGDAGLLPRGDAYGEFKLEKVCHDFRVHAPKYYTYRTDNGELKVRCKGYPKKTLTPAVRQALHDNKDRVEITYESGTSLITSVKTHKLSIDRKRTQTSASNVYGHIVEDGKFRPRRLDS